MNTALRDIYNDLESITANVAKLKKQRQALPLKEELTSEARYQWKKGIGNQLTIKRKNA